MKQSPPRPCYLVVVVSRCREMAMTVVMVVVVGERDDGGSEMRECVHEASVSVKEKEGEGKERRERERRRPLEVIFNHRDDGRFPGGPLTLAQETG